MTQTVRVPDPVYDRIEREAQHQDVQFGAVIRDWMEANDELQELEARQ